MKSEAEREWLGRNRRHETNRGRKGWGRDHQDSHQHIRTSCGVRLSTPLWQRGRFRRREIRMVISSPTTKVSTWLHMQIRTWTSWDLKAILMLMKTFVQLRTLFHSQEQGTATGPPDTDRPSYKIPRGQLRLSAYALQQIRAFQQRTDLLMPKKLFMRWVQHKASQHSFMTATMQASAY